MVHVFLHRLALAVCPKWTNLALKRSHCLDTDDGTLAAMMSSKVDVSLLVDFGLLWLNEADTCFSVP